MTALATGSSASVTLRDNGKCTVTTNGGFASVVETVAGVSTTHAFGPRPMRMTFGPYSEGATLTITNSSAVLDYDSPNSDVRYARDSSGNVTGLVGPDGATIGYVLNLVSTAAAVSVTGTTTKTALRTIAIPNGAMGANSRLIIKPIWGYTNSANNKVLTVDVGTTLGGATSIYTRTRTTTAAEMPLIEIANRNDVNAQLIGYAQTGSYTTANSVANTTATIAFGTSGMNIYVSGTLANTGETITLDSLQVDIVNPYQ